MKSICRVELAFAIVRNDSPVQNKIDARSCSLLYVSLSFSFQGTFVQFNSSAQLFLSSSIMEWRTYNRGTGPEMPDLAARAVTTNWNGTTRVSFNSNLRPGQLHNDPRGRGRPTEVHIPEMGDLERTAWRLRLPDNPVDVRSKGETESPRKSNGETPKKKRFEPKNEGRRSIKISLFAGNSLNICALGKELGTIANIVCSRGKLSAKRLCKDSSETISSGVCCRVLGGGSGSVFLYPTVSSGTIGLYGTKGRSMWVCLSVLPSFLL